LVERIETVISARLRRLDPTTAAAASSRPPKPPLTVLTKEQEEEYVKCEYLSSFIRIDFPQDLADSSAVYFEHVHPLYPFMDVNSWQATVSRPDFHRDLDRNKPWYCLYHAVLALGCQHAQGGSFEAGKSSSWGIFSLALDGFSDLLLLPDSLIVLQALMAMSLYGLGVDALAIEHVILSEAARRAQSMSKMQFSGTAAHVYRRTFWMLYSMEKVMAFHFGRSSVSSMPGGTVFLPLTK
jgi:hypothetical protein